MNFIQQASRLYKQALKPSLASLKRKEDWVPQERCCGISDVIGVVMNEE